MVVAIQRSLHMKMTLDIFLPKSDDEVSSFRFSLKESRRNMSTVLCFVQKVSEQSEQLPHSNKAEG